jgi:ketosteroid isomerase-like protein
MTPHMLAIELARLVNERDLAAATALFTPDAEVCFPRYAPRAVFRGAELEELYDWMVARMPVYTMAVDRITAGESSATVEFETTGVSDTGQAFDNVGAMVLDARGGLIASLRLYVDTADLGRILERSAAA